MNLYFCFDPISLQIYKMNTVCQYLLSVEWEQFYQPYKSKARTYDCTGECSNEREFCLQGKYKPMKDLFVFTLPSPVHTKCFIQD